MVESKRGGVVRQMADIRRVHGREHEREVLAAAVDDVTSGVARVLVLQGPPGIGKTTLLRVLSDTARHRGLQVRRGRADEVGRRPFGPLLEALDDLVTARPGLPDDRPDPEDHDGLRYRMVDELVAGAETAALRGGLVLVVDDLQWADPDTVLALRALGRWLADSPLLLAVATRPVPRRADLDRLLAALEDDGATVLALGPLQDHAVRSLAADVLGSPPDAAVQDALEQAGGNPLYLVELLRQDGRAPVPSSLVRLVQRGLADLPARDMRLLQDAAVLGSTVVVADLAAVADLPVDETARACEDMVAAGVLVHDGGGTLRFTHDVVRQALVDSLSAPVLASLHQRVAWRLAAHGSSPLRVAEHLLCSRPRPGDRRAVDWLRRAAAEQVRHAPSTAADLLGQALSLLAPDETDRAVLLAEHVEALLRAGAVDGARRAAEDGLSDQLPTDVRERLLVALTEARTAAGDLAGVLTSAGEVLATRQLSTAARARLLALVANAHDVLGQPAAADATALRAIDVAADDPLATRGRVMAQLVRADVARVTGDLERAVLLAEGVRLEEDERGPLSPWPPEVFVGMALYDADEMDRAERVVAEGLRRGHRWGRMTYQPTLHTIAAHVLASTGRWDDALSQARAALVLADDVELGFLQDWTRGIAAELLVRRGDLEEAQRILAPLTCTTDASTRPRVVLAQALLHEADGEESTAHRLLSSQWSLSAGSRPEVRALAVDTMRLALACGDEAATARVVSTMVDLTRPDDTMAGLRGLALLCRGMATGDVDVLLRAVEVLAGAPRVHELHTGRAQAGLALAAHGDDRAPTVLKAAVAGLEDLGARREVARTVAAARALGVEVGRPREARRPDSGPEALTPAEREVASLAATGLTNPQIGERLFVSPRTVQSHLASTYRKLGIRSRVQLAAMLSTPPR